MSMRGDERPPRPERIVWAAWVMGVTAAIGVYFITSMLSSWTSLGTQETIANLIKSTRLDDFVSGDPVAALRIYLFAALIAAIATIVFAVFVTRGDQDSRIALSILGTFMAVFFLASGSTAILPAVMPAVGVWMLWSKPAREWFAAMNKSEPTPEGYVRPEQLPVVQSRLAQPKVPAVSAERPAMLIFAFIVTLIFAGLVATTALLWWVTFRANPELLTDAIINHPLDAVRELPKTLGQSVTQLVSTMNTLITVLGAISFVGVIAAFMAVRGARGGRELLMTMAGVAVILSVLGFPVGIVWTAAGAFVFYAMNRLDVKLWFRDHGAKKQR